MDVAYADTIFQNLVFENKVPGISVTILKNDGVFIQKGYGYANLEKQKSVNPKESLFRVASISKCITGLALGKMVEERPLSGYIETTMGMILPPRGLSFATLALLNTAFVIAVGSYL
ncbi:MAG: serine hydrolase domain-containing protein, partial [Bacteroidota bacterium]